MSRWLVLVLTLLGACSSSTAPSSSQPLTIAGTWAQNAPLPGGEMLVFTVDATGNGTGTYTNNVRSGTVRVVSGVTTITPGTFILTMFYDTGLVRGFPCTLTDASHLTGTFSDSSTAVGFTRR